MKLTGQAWTALALATVSSGLIACAQPTVRATLPALQSRAAFDLGCPAPWLRLYPLDARAKGVEGCGRRLVYLEVCSPLGDRAQCTWRLEPASPWSAAGGTATPRPPPTGATAPPGRPAAPSPAPTMTPAELLRDRT